MTRMHGYGVPGMTPAQAYAELVKVNAKCDALENDRRFHHRTADYSALVDRWIALANVIDPECKIDFWGDITVFAPHQTAPANQMELFA